MKTAPQSNQNNAFDTSTGCKLYLLRLLGVLIVAIMVGLHWPAPTAAALPAAASPWVTFCVLIASRKATLFAIAAVPLLLAGFWRGRWFCRMLCPTGTFHRLVEWCRPQRDGLLQRSPPVGTWLMWLGVGGAAAGWPLFLQLDPLVIATGFFSAWRRTTPFFDWRSGAAMLILLALAWVCPRLWCTRLCPLGAWLAFSYALRKALLKKLPASTTKATTAGIERRTFLGAAVGFALGHLMSATHRTASVVRPPGAVAEDSFNGMCARCGNCIRVCPANIIRPAYFEAGFAGLLTPRLDFSRDYCHELCAACMEVCPTGAIRRMTLPKKQNLRLGLAKIDRARCIAWAQGKHCMVCDEFCPYKAIRAVEQKGVKCPEVMADVCRGCGACESQCPAEPVRAIKIAPR